MCGVCLAGVPATVEGLCCTMPVGGDRVEPENLGGGSVEAGGAMVALDPANLDLGGVDGAETDMARGCWLEAPGL